MCMRVSEYAEFSKATGEPKIDAELFNGSEQFFNGGTRGKNEYKRHVSITAVFGRCGSKTYFRGECWSCGESHIGVRTQHNKNLLKCQKCGETSFVYKGFFSNRDRYPLSDYEIPTKSEVNGTMHICMETYSDLAPSLSVLSKSSYKKKLNDPKYDVQLIEKR